MFIVKLMKFGTALPVGAPAPTEVISVREASAVHVRQEPDGGRTVLQLGDAPGDTMEFTVGQRQDCSYTIAYIMNSTGKTVETVR